MSIIKDILSARLEERNIFSVEVERLIKDVSIAIGTERDAVPSDLKQALKGLGWEEDVLDYRTMELVSAVLENEPEFEINHSP